MGILERKERLRLQTRKNILDAAMRIVREEGWQALSMRKIADVIEYSAPVIYEHFINKEAILVELTSHGFQKLSKLMHKARSVYTDPEKQMENMWLAYWNFAFAEEEYYQLMFGVNMPCCKSGQEIAAQNKPYELIRSVLVRVLKADDSDEDLILAKFYSYWAMVHGLISINLVRKGGTQEMSQQILISAVSDITHSLLT